MKTSVIVDMVVAADTIEVLPTFKKMSFFAISSGLELISWYNPHHQEDDSFIRTGNGCIWAGDLSWGMSEGDKMKIKQLGWMEDFKTNEWVFK